MDDDFGWIFWLILLPFILAIAAMVGMAWCFYKFLSWVWKSPKRITIFWGVISGLIAGLAVSIAIGDLLVRITNMSQDEIDRISVGIGAISSFVTICLYFRYLAPNIYSLLIGQDNQANIPTRHDLSQGYNRYGEIE